MLILSIHRSTAGIHIVRIKREGGEGEEMSGQRKRKLADLKLDVKRKPGRRRGRWRIRKEVLQIL